MDREPGRPELEAGRVLESARAEFEGLDEPWDGYRVDVELIATLLFSLGVQRVPDLRVGQREYAACLNGQARLIAVEERHHAHRQRFSIAHEVGHFVLHYLPRPSGQGLFACSNSDMEVDLPAVTPGPRMRHLRQEAEANLFAGELLMPQEPLLAMYRVTGGHLLKLAKHFDVSPKAMEIRLSRLPLPFAPVHR